MRASTHAALALTLCLLGATHARAQVPADIPSTVAETDAAIAKFDPKAVAAARHYIESPAMRTGLRQVADAVVGSMYQQFRAMDKDFTEADAAKLQTIVREAMVKQEALMGDLNVLSTLETFTTEEIVAVDAFYSSPVGASVLAKMPKVAARVPVTMRAVMPRMLEDVKAGIASSGLGKKP